MRLPVHILLRSSAIPSFSQEDSVLHTHTDTHTHTHTHTHLFSVLNASSLFKGINHIEKVVSEDCLDNKLCTLKKSQL